MRSRALRMEAGSYVFRVVLTVMLPSIRSSVQSICSELGVNLKRCFVRAYVVGLQRSGDKRPCFFEVHLSVFGEEGSERRFFGEGASSIIGGLERFFLIDRQ